MTWRLLLTPPASGADNMALDEALLVSARERGGGTVRVYSWSRPTVSLGRNQHVAGAWDRERAASLGVGFVRRLTGGRALLHHREITYSVTARRAPGRGPREDYARINALLVESLRRLGVTGVAIARPGLPMAPPGHAACFERPAPGELVLDGAKLVGSAQVQQRGAWLQHGSILLGDDQHLLASLTRGAPPDIRPAATLQSALGRAPSPAEFAEALFGAVRNDWDPLAIEAAPDPAEHALAADLRGRYEDPDWTWGGT